MNAKYVGNALVITSAVKAKDIKELAVRNPDALNYYEGEGDKRELVFAVATGECPVVEDLAIVFDGKTHDEDGFATATIVVGDLEKPQDVIADLFGIALKHLKAWEETVPAALEKARAERAELLDLIEV